MSANELTAEEHDALQALAEHGQTQLAEAARKLLADVDGGAGEPR